MKVVIDGGPADNSFNIDDNTFHQIGIEGGEINIESSIGPDLSSLSSTDIPLLSPGWIGIFGEFNISELACDGSEASIVCSANLDKCGYFSAIYFI